MERRRVRIATEGGATLGIGHLSRCQAIAQAFSEAGFEVSFAVAGDPALGALLPPQAAAWFDWRREPERLLAGIDSRTVALVDSYHAAASLLDDISRQAGVAVFLDDYRRLDYPPGLVVNWSVGAAGLGYPPRDGVTYLLGPAYAALRRPFRDAVPRSPRTAIAEALVSFGGDDGRGLTAPALRLLGERFPAWRKTAVVGPACGHRAAIAAAADPRTRLLVAPGADQMARAMAEADVAVTSGGQTLFELARLGLPAAVTAVAENQKLNVADWAAAGTIENVGLWSDPDWEERLRAALHRLEEPGRRQAAAAAGPRRVPGDGGAAIVRAVQERLAG